MTHKLAQRRKKIKLNLSAGSPLYHVSGNIVWKEDSPMKEVCQNFCTVTAGRKRRDEDVQKSSYESQRPRQ